MATPQQMATPQPISEREISEMSSTLQSSVVSVVMEQVRGMLHLVDSTSLNIAVTGEAGAGKSTFVNAFRGVHDDDPDAAKTGVTETMQQASAYAHPSALNVRLWDLPGIGTPMFRPESYLEDVGLLQYDFFIILTCDRFREIHMELARAISLAGKQFYFVRNKVDRDQEASFRRGVLEADVLEDIRSDCLQKLQKAGMQQPEVFLISCFQPQSLDLPRLQSRLLEGLDDLKRRALLRSLPSYTAELLEHKRQELAGELWWSAMSACLHGVTHGDAIEGAVPKLMETLRSYQRSFGLDDASLHRLATMTCTTYEELREEVRSLSGQALARGTLEQLLSLVAPAPQFLIMQLEMKVPVLGNVVSGAVSFVVALCLLRTALTDFRQDAERVMQRAFGNHLLTITPADHNTTQKPNIT